jgi:hypothetical protein
MNEWLDPEAEGFEELLGRIPPVAAEDRLRHELLWQTTTLLVRRRRLKLLAYAGALAACYLAGVLSMRLWRVSPTVEQPPVAQGQTSAPQKPSTKPIEPRSLPAGAVEQEARADREHRRQLYRLAGDRYLEENSDAVSALRCYREALQSGSDSDLTISPDDNWLLMALKKDKQEEVNRARNKS